MKNIKKLQSVCLALSVMAMSALSAGAAELFNDTFTSGTANENGWYFWSTNSGGTAWTFASTAPVGSTLVDGRSLRKSTTGSQGVTAALKSFSAVTLTQVNDFVSVSLDIHVIGTTAGAPLQVGFYNRGEAIASNGLGAFAANPVADKTGYTYWQYLAGGQAATYALRTGDTVDDGKSSTTANIPEAALASGVDHNIVFTLTVTEEGLRLSTVFDGMSMSGYTLSSVSGTAVDTLRLFTSGTPNAVSFDNISVTTNVIPEPSNAGILIGFGAVVAAMATRLRRCALRRRIS